MQTTHLKETPSAAPVGARMIDASFEVVKPGRRERKSARKKDKKPKSERGVIGKVRYALGVAAMLALIGLLIPPAIVLSSLVLGAAG